MLTYGFSMNEDRQLLINGKLADNDRIYKLVTLDLFTFGYFIQALNMLRKIYSTRIFTKHYDRLWSKILSVIVDKTL